jgi:hypothetical protein
MYYHGGKAMRQFYNPTRLLFASQWGAWEDLILQAVGNR